MKMDSQRYFGAIIVAGLLASTPANAADYSIDTDGDTLNWNLTIHGVTKAAAIQVELIGEGEVPWGGYRSGFNGQKILRASDFRLPDWLGNIDLEFNIEGVRN